METSFADRRKIILSADDFGMNAKANDRILELASLGKIDRVAVMIGIDRNFTQNEVASLMRSGIKMDIHLDLPGFNDDGKHTGILSRTIIFVYLRLIGKIAKEEISLSWKKQVELFKSRFGRYPDGINSHEHVHFFPSYFKIARDLQNEFNIPFIRLGKKDVLHFHDSRHLILRFMRHLISRNTDLQNIISSDHMVSLDWISDIENFANNLPEGTTEIICHPERDDEYKAILKWF